MNIRNIRITSAIVIWLIAILQILGTEYYLYWVFPPFDVIMHFLGGLFIGLTWIWFTLYKKLPNDKKYILISALITVIIVGILWELFETIFNIQDVFSAEHIVDTLSDILMDIIGGLTAIILFIKFPKKT